MTAEELKTRNFESEFQFSASRSGGAGGQNVNKVNTKIELRFPIAESRVLRSEEKDVLLLKLKNQINSLNELILVSQEARTQIQNKKICVEKFFEIISKALTPRKRRKPTKPSAISQEKRLNTKRLRSEKKDLRRKLE